MRECVACEGAYEPVRSDQRYCSRACKDSRPGRVRARYKPRNCEVCETSYGPTYMSQRTCSRLCGAKINAYPCSDTNRHRIAHFGKARAAQNAARFRFSRGSYRVIDPRQCVECQRFLPGGSRKYCGEKCAYAGKVRCDREYREKFRPSEPRRCVCGSEISEKRNKCAECISESRRLRRKRDKQRRRALKLGVASEPYTLGEIASRDGYRCGLCHRKVTLTLRVPHHGAPTIDHVIPMARGGDDTRANVQLAHFICNSTKGDRLAGEQLALVG